MKEKRNITIDTFRIIASIFIVFIHTSMIRINGQVHYNIPLYIISSTLSRYCVPLFMMITGYFYYRNPSHYNRKKILKTLGSLWFIWMLIYSPVGIRGIKAFSFGYLAKFLIKQVFFSSDFYWGSWYLIATIFGILFVDFFRRKNCMYVCAFVAVILSIIDSFTSYYYFLVKPYSLILGTPGDFSMSILTGIIWLTLVYYIVKYQKKLIQFGKIQYLCLGILITFVEFFVMINIVPFPDYKYPGALQSPLTLPISVFFVFMFMIVHKYYMNKSKIIWMRDLSTLIFFTQFGVIDVFNFLNQKKLIYITVNNYMYFVLAITIIVSIIIYVFSLKKGFRWLQYLYGGK